MTTVVVFYISDDIRKKTTKQLHKYFDASASTAIEKGCYDFTKQYCINNNNTDMWIAIYKDIGLWL